MNCRAGCGACCIAPSISSLIPSLPDDESASLPDDESTSLPDDESASLPDEESTSLPKDESASLPDDESTSLPDDESTSLPKDESASLPKDESASLPKGKPAGVRCAQLDDNNRCMIFGDPRRPAVCSSLRASVEMCGTDVNVMTTRIHAMTFLTRLEAQTR